MVNKLLKDIKEYEEIILGGLSNTTRIDILSDILEPNHFIFEINKEVYSIIYNSYLKDIDNWFPKSVELIKTKHKFNWITKYNKTEIVSSSSLIFYAKELKELHKKYKTIDLLDKSKQLVIEKGYDGFIDEFNGKLTNIDSINEKNPSDPKSIFESIEKTRSEYAEKYKNGITMLGMSSGYNFLDELTDGIRNGNIWVVGAYQGTGKTFFSLNIASNLVEQKKRVVYYSLEMNNDDVMGRLVGIKSEMNYFKYIKGILDSDEKERIEKAKKSIIESNFTIHSNITNIDKIILSMKQECIKGKVDMFMLDYIQLMESTKGSDYESIKNNIMALQHTVKKLGVPILVLSQVDNASAKNPNGRVAGFKGAGDIGATADLAVIMDWDRDLYSTNEDYQETMKFSGRARIIFSIYKNRYGIGGNYATNFIGKYGIFNEIGED